MKHALRMAMPVFLFHVLIHGVLLNLINWV